MQLRGIVENLANVPVDNKVETSFWLCTNTGNKYKCTALCPTLREVKLLEVCIAEAAEVTINTTRYIEINGIPTYFVYLSSLKIIGGPNVEL